jgi:hypothetical protein
MIAGLRGRFADFGNRDREAIGFSEDDNSCVNGLMNPKGGLMNPEGRSGDSVDALEAVDEFLCQRFAGFGPEEAAADAAVFFDREGEG